jgi:hypothetical protein
MALKGMCYSNAELALGNASRQVTPELMSLTRCFWLLEAGRIWRITVETFKLGRSRRGATCCYAWFEDSTSLPLRLGRCSRLRRSIRLPRQCTPRCRILAGKTDIRCGVEIAHALRTNEKGRTVSLHVVKGRGPQRGKRAVLRASIGTPLPNRGRALLCGTRPCLQGCARPP